MFCHNTRLSFFACQKDAAGATLKKAAPAPGGSSQQKIAYSRRNLPDIHDETGSIIVKNLPLNGLPLALFPLAEGLCLEVGQGHGHHAGRVDGQQAGVHILHLAQPDSGCQQDTDKTVKKYIFLE